MDDLDEIIDQELLLQSDRPSHRRPFSAGTLRSMFGDTQPLSPHRTPTPAAPPRAVQSQDGTLPQMHATMLWENGSGGSSQ